jgi:GTPase SAR1 family protein
MKPTPLELERILAQSSDQAFLETVLGLHAKIAGQLDRLGPSDSEFLRLLAAVRAEIVARLDFSGDSPDQQRLRELRDWLESLLAQGPLSGAECQTSFQPPKRKSIRLPGLFIRPEAETLAPFPFCAPCDRLKICQHQRIFRENSVIIRHLTVYLEPGSGRIVGDHTIEASLMAGMELAVHQVFTLLAPLGYVERAYDVYYFIEGYDRECYQHNSLSLGMAVALLALLLDREQDIMAAGWVFSGSLSEAGKIQRVSRIQNKILAAMTEPSLRQIGISAQNRQEIDDLIQECPHLAEAASRKNIVSFVSLAEVHDTVLGGFTPYRHYLATRLARQSGVSPSLAGHLFGDALRQEKAPVILCTPSIAFGLSGEYASIFSQEISELTQAAEQLGAIRQDLAPKADLWLELSIDDLPPGEEPEKSILRRIFEREAVIPQKLSRDYHYFILLSQFEQSEFPRELASRMSRFSQTFGQVQWIIPTKQPGEYRHYFNSGGATCQVLTQVRLTLEYHFDILDQTPRLEIRANRMPITIAHDNQQRQVRAILHHLLAKFRAADDDVRFEQLASYLLRTDPPPQAPLYLALFQLYLDQRRLLQAERIISHARQLWPNDQTIRQAAGQVGSWWRQSFNRLHYSWAPLDIAILGPRKAGKTTLVNMIRHNSLESRYPRASRLSNYYSPTIGHELSEIFRIAIDGRNFRLRTCDFGGDSIYWRTWAEISVYGGRIGDNRHLPRNIQREISKLGKKELRLPPRGMIFVIDHQDFDLNVRYFTYVKTVIEHMIRSGHKNPCRNILLLVNKADLWQKQLSIRQIIEAGQFIPGERGVLARLRELPPLAGAPLPSNGSIAELIQYCCDHFGNSGKALEYLVPLFDIPESIPQTSAAYSRFIEELYDKYHVSGMSKDSEIVWTFDSLIKRLHDLRVNTMVEQGSIRLWPSLLAPLRRFIENLV